MYDELVESLRLCVKYGKAQDALENSEQAADAIEGLSHAVDQMTEWRKNPWIPVTKEPPLKVGDDGYNGYLVYANGYYEVADYAIDKLDNVPNFHVCGEYEPDVTHYMPLPEPPTKEEGE